MGGDDILHFQSVMLGWEIFFKSFPNAGGGGYFEGCSFKMLGFEGFLSGVTSPISNVCISPLLPSNLGWGWVHLYWTGASPL